MHLYTLEDMSCSYAHSMNFVFDIVALLRMPLCTSPHSQLHSCVIFLRGPDHTLLFDLLNFALCIAAS